MRGDEVVDTSCELRTSRSGTWAAVRGTFNDNHLQRRHYSFECDDAGAERIGTAHHRK
jgi:hypothetical protein